MQTQPNDQKHTEFSIDDLLKLDNQLCFALYVSAKEVVRKYRPLLDPLGLTYTEYIAMLALWEKDGVSVKLLGERLSLDSGTLTPMLKRMEKNGLLTRRRSSEDERIVLIDLTDQGKDLKAKVIDIPNQMICQMPINMESALSLISQLHAMIEGLKNPE